MGLDKKSARNRLAVIPLVVQYKVDAPGLAVNKQAVLEPGLGKLAVMSKKFVPGDVSQRAAAQEPSVGKVVVLQVALDKCVEQNKMAVPAAESHFQYHPLAAADLQELQTLAEYNPAEHFSVVMP